MKKIAFIAALAVAAALSSVAQAATTFDSLSAWKTAAGTFTRDTTYGPDSTDTSSVTLDGGVTLGLSPTTNIRTVGTSWSTWSGGYTGQVLFASGITSVTSSISPIGAFGFFIEPNPFSVESFTLELSDGSTITRAYDGSGGAGFLGWVGPGVTSFKITSAEDFAFGDFFSGGGSGVPEPATWAMMITGFGLMGAMLRRRRVAGALSA